MSDGIRDGFRNPLVTGVSIPDGTIDTQHIADGAVSSTKIDTNLQSDNYDGGVISSNPGTVGWRIERNTGDAVFNDVTVRGTIIATAGSISGTLTMGTGGKIQFTRNSNASITTNHSPQNGDFWITFGAGGSVGRIQGLQRSGGVDLVRAELQIISTGFEVAAGEFHIRGTGAGAIIDSPLGQDIQIRIAGTNRIAIGNLAGVDGGSSTGINMRNTDINNVRIARVNEVWGDDGDVNDPTYTFASNNDSGMYLDSTNGPAITHDGVLQFRTSNNASYAMLLGPARLSWTSDSDTYLQRAGANDIRLTAGNVDAQWRGNTTTNSGLASWRHNSFGGSSPFELLPLTSSEKFKKNIRDLTVKRARRILGMYRPREWKSLAPADPPNVWMPGFVVEESPKTPKDLIAPLLVVVAELQSRVTELEEAA